MNENIISLQQTLSMKKNYLDVYDLYYSARVNLYEINFNLNNITLM